VNANAANTSTNLIDEYALNRIEYRAIRLRCAFRLNEHDTEDLRSRLAVQLLRASARFDPTRASQHTFVNRVLDRAYRHLARELRTRREHAVWAPLEPLECEDDGESAQSQTGDAPDPAEVVERRSDVETALASLPRPLRVIGEELKHSTPREVAERLGLHRSTVYRAMGRIREHFTAYGLGELM